MAAGVDIQGERKNGAVVAPTLLILASGLLVLAGVLSAARPALAQAQLECPLPAGVTLPADADPRSDGATGGRRQREPDGLHAGRKR